MWLFLRGESSWNNQTAFLQDYDGYNLSMKKTEVVRTEKHRTQEPDEREKLEPPEQQTNVQNPKHDQIITSPSASPLIKVLEQKKDKANGKRIN